MGLGLEAISGGTMDVGNSKSRVRRKILNDDDDDDAGESGCWIKFRFFGSCLSTRSKVDSSVSGSSSQYGTFSYISLQCCSKIIYLLFPVILCVCCRSLSVYERNCEWMMLILDWHQLTFHWRTCYRLCL